MPDGFAKTGCASSHPEWRGSCGQVAARGGRTLAASREALRTILAKRDDQGVRAGAVSRRQAKSLFAAQQGGLDASMRRHPRTPAQQVAFVCRLP